MTSGDKPLKRAARERALRLGISYTRARRQILAARDHPAFPPPSGASGARVITVAHVRGGTGVSTLAAALADTYARGGRRVLLVDTDDVPLLRAGALVATAPPPPDLSGRLGIGNGPEATGSAIRQGAPPQGPWEVVGLAGHPGWAALAVAVPGTGQVLDEVVSRARGVFDVVVVDLSPAGSWEVPGDRVVVPLPELQAQDLEWVEILDRRPAHLRMFDWFNLAYADLPDPQGGDRAAFGALVSRERGRLSSLTAPEQDRWWSRHAFGADGQDRLPRQGEDTTDGGDGVSPQAFLEDIQERARSGWGTVWQEHGRGWLGWRTDPDAQRDTTGFEHQHHLYSAQEAADRYLGRSDGSLMTLPDVPHVVGVFTRQRDLPERMRALADQVRGVLSSHGVRVADAAFPQLEELPPMMAGGRSVRWDRSPASVGENLAALADALLA